MGRAVCVKREDFIFASNPIHKTERVLTLFARDKAKYANFPPFFLFQCKFTETS